MGWHILRPSDTACNSVCVCNQVVAVLEQLRFAAVSAVEHLLALYVLCNGGEYITYNSGSALWGNQRSAFA